MLASRSHWRAQTKVPIQASTLPDPEVSLQHFTVGSPQPFSGYESSDFYYTGFGVSQDIPGPGKLSLQKTEAEKDAEFAKHRYEAAEREVEECRSLIERVRAESKEQEATAELMERIRARFREDGRNPDDPDDPDQRDDPGDGPPADQGQPRRFRPDVL